MDDREALRRAYVDEGLSLTAIAAMVGTSYASVRRALIDDGVPIRRSGPEPITRLREREWLRARVGEGLSAAEIASGLGCAEETVRSALQGAGLLVATRDPHPALADKAFLERRYLAEAGSVRSIAHELGVSKDAVLRALRRHGIQVRARGPSRKASGSVLASAAGGEVMSDEPPREDAVLASEWDAVLEMDVPPAEPPDPDLVRADAPAPSPEPLAEQEVDVEEPLEPDEAEEAEPVTPLRQSTPPPREPPQLPPRGASRVDASGTPAGTVPKGRVELEIDKIEAKTFPVARRGYEPSEVDAFLRAVAEDYRHVVRSAREAIAAAQQAEEQARQEAAVDRTGPSFEDVGGRVAAVLRSAAEAGEEIKAQAVDDAAAIRQKANDETSHLRQAIANELAEAEELRAQAAQEAAEVRTLAEAEASSVISAAREHAARVRSDAEERAATLERTARANIDALIAEARREYEHLRSVQQQCLDRLASVEFLAKHARDGLSEQFGQPLDERL